MPRPVASPTVTHAEVFNDRATVVLPVRVSERVRPGVVAVPWGWWSTQHPDGRAANALTNDTLTDWGGGVAFFDTLVDVRAAAGSGVRGATIRN